MANDTLDGYASLPKPYIERGSQLDLSSRARILPRNGRSAHTASTQPWRWIGRMPARRRAFGRLCRRAPTPPICLSKRLAGDIGEQSL